MLKLSSEITRRLISSTKPQLPRTCRQLSGTKTLFDAKSPGNNETTAATPIQKWYKIYQMDEIAFLSIISKLKIYQGVASAICIPLGFIGETMKVAPDDITFVMISITATAMSMLWSYSGLVKDTIGIIYVCPKNESIRFAYLDFWGRRNYYDTTIDNIVEPTGKNILGLFQIVKLRDGAKTFKLATRHGEISDFDSYEQLFGRLQE